MIEVVSFKDGKLHTDWRPTAFAPDSQQYKDIEAYLESTEELVLHGDEWEFHYRKMK